MRDLKAGSKVVCVDDSIMNLITIGKVYDIQEVLEFGKIRIFRDDNNYGIYNVSRFVSIQEKRNDVIDEILDL